MDRSSAEAFQDWSIEEADHLARGLRAAREWLALPLAQAAQEFVRQRAWQFFGFSRLEDFCRERLGRSGRWLRDLASLHAGLEVFPELAAAMVGLRRVVIRSPVAGARYAGDVLDLARIAREAEVDSILTGTIVRAASRVRVTSQLLEVPGGTVIWSDFSEIAFDDLFHLQDTIVGRLVESLSVSLTPHERMVLKADVPSNPAVYELYLRANQVLAAGVMGGEQLLVARDLYQRALEHDPNYAPAWDELAHNFSNAVSINVLSTSEGLVRSREAATKALSIDPDYAPAHARLGWVALHENDMPGAAQHFERALAFDPADSRVLEYAASLLIDLGRIDEGLVLEEALVRRDPVNVMALNSLANAQHSAGRLDAAISTFRTSLSLSPDRGAAHFQFGMTLLSKGDAAGALAEIEQETSEVWSRIGHAIAYHALGRNAESGEALAELIAKYEQDCGSCHVRFNKAAQDTLCLDCHQPFGLIDSLLPGGFQFQPSLANFQRDHRFGVASHAKHCLCLFGQGIGLVARTAHVERVPLHSLPPQRGQVGAPQVFRLCE